MLDNRSAADMRALTDIDELELSWRIAGDSPG
jgi:hypothetical protein